MFTKLASIALRFLLIGGMIVAVTSSARGEQDTSCPGGGIPYEAGTEYMLKTYGEVPTVMAPLNKRDWALVIFANPDMRTWTQFLLGTDGCLLEMRNINGDGWPLAVPSPGAKDSAKVAS